MIGIIIPINFMIGISYLINQKPLNLNTSLQNLETNKIINGDLKITVSIIDKKDMSKEDLLELYKNNRVRIRDLAKENKGLKTKIDKLK